MRDAAAAAGVGCAVTFGMVFALSVVFLATSTDPMQPIAPVRNATPVAISTIPTPTPQTFAPINDATPVVWTRAIQCWPGRILTEKGCDALASGQHRISHINP